MCPRQPTPVPSFRGVPEEHRSLHLARPAAVSTRWPRGALEPLCDVLVEASVPVAYKNASARWRSTGPITRPGAGPGGKTTPSRPMTLMPRGAMRSATPREQRTALFRLLRPGGDDGRRRGRCPCPRARPAYRLAGAPVDPAGVMAKTLVPWRRRGDPRRRLADCGYSNRAPLTFAAPPRARRRSGDGPPPGRPGMPRHLRGSCRLQGARCIARPPRTRSSTRAAAVGRPRRSERPTRPASPSWPHTGSPALCAPDADGYQRVICPAAAGKVRCPHKATSLRLSSNARACREHPRAATLLCPKSITVPAQVNEKTRQKHHYAGPAHPPLTTGAPRPERTYASLADPSIGGIRRGWCRLFGLAKNTLMYALESPCATCALSSPSSAADQEPRAAAIGPLALADTAIRPSRR